METASLFPAANVIGMDLVAPPADATQPLGHGLERRPDNYAFAPGNVPEGLPFAYSSFDFVHQRLLITAVPREWWPNSRA